MIFCEPVDVFIITVLVFLAVLNEDTTASGQLEVERFLAVLFLLLLDTIGAEFLFVMGR